MVEWLGNNIRVTDVNGNPWFVANDVCKALRLSNPREAVRPLQKDQKGVVQSDTLGGTQRVTTISEGGCYALVMRSAKPRAREFQVKIVNRGRQLLRSIRGMLVYV